jgi:diguanylate cyclase (GGDEF)-like protein
MAQRQIDIARRSGQEMVLVFIDLDRMKDINDSYGHDAGDMALIGAFDILKTTFRNSDLIGRWGGDEFVVLMINASSEDEKRLNERLRKNAEHYKKQFSLKYDISLSAGITMFNSKLDSNLETIIEQADAAMYKFKRSKQKLYRAV